ncbi:Activator of stress genes 1 [Madurella mycetomatis]|uniref:Activator of stress genes 1 n=1 Tax=Madurella mycetomatis TaxID=100816 RepID=A0A175W3U9_9PEZI|nr:Activator of stress genes 1 [Madurella mycetomatis]
MSQRINHLEDVVKKLIAERQQASSASSSSVVYTTESPNLDGLKSSGRTVMDGVRSVHLGADDWHVVLEEIKELKNTWKQEQDGQGDCGVRSGFSHLVDGSSLLFNQVKPIERMEILSALPPKPEVDQLLARFFDCQAFPISVPPILHQSTFLHEYNGHWRDPSRTDFIWLGLLFSILGITMLAFHQYGEPLEYEGLSESLFHLYRMRTAQCLLSGDIAKCLPYTVETLRLNATAELNRKDDNRRGLWIMTGVIVRAAINMGYHRDPSQCPGISVLQAEYRRRIWLSVISMDDAASFLGGFPRTTSAIFSDTKEPRNLHDWELSETTTVLPPSRPLTEPTPVTYLIVKGRLFRALGRVADFHSAPDPSSYKTVLEIDRAVQDVYESFPPHMKVGSRGSISGTLQTNLSNLSLLGMYHKGICTLHRRFLAKERDNGRFQFSRDRCISAALALLALQEGLEPFLYKVSQIRQMLTLAAMVLFLELELRRKYPGTGESPDSRILLHALEQSCARWAEATDAYDEAWRLHQFLASMLSGFHVGTGAGTEASQMVSHEILPGFSPRFDVANGCFSLEEDLSNTDFDWSAWDTFFAAGDYESDPVY